MESSLDIQKLAVMLPTYLYDRGFFEETSRTDWPNLDAYRDKMSQRTQLVNQHLFVVEYVENIMQQECESLDCGDFVAGYAEYLSEGIRVPPRSRNCRNVYCALHFRNVHNDLCLMKVFHWIFFLPFCGLSRSILYIGGNTFSPFPVVSSSSTLLGTFQSFLSSIEIIGTL
ncbi:hypothetical protein P3L10_003446 [Capsicum annuum]